VQKTRTYHSLPGINRTGMIRASNWKKATAALGTLAYFGAYSLRCPSYGVI